MEAPISNFIVSRVIDHFRKIKRNITSSPFSCLDIFLLILSVTSFLADIGTDIAVITQYYLSRHYKWMLLTLSLVCFPSFVIQIFSIRWYIIDSTASKYLYIVHIFQLGVLNRYVELFNVGLKVRFSKSSVDLKQFHRQQSDICMLRLFESFMESAPQLVLQLYIMVDNEDWNLWTGVSAIASLSSLSWGIAAYSKAMRNVRPEKKRLSWCGLITQSLWHIGTVSSRVIAMVLFAVAFGPWLILIMFLHWLFMTIWVITQKTDFCITWWEELLYNCVVGSIYCFCFFNLKEGQSRWRMASFYSLLSVQNICFITAYYCSDKAKENMKEISLFLVFFGMIAGLTSMMLYYCFFHPSGKIFVFGSRTEHLGQDASLTESGSTLKTSRKPNKISCDIQSSFNAEDHVPLKVLENSVLSLQSHNQHQSCIHHSHSFNCSFDAEDMDILTSKNSFKTFKLRVLSRHNASHFKRVNYNFRSAVAFGKHLSKTHCSCLVLSDTEMHKHFSNRMTNLNAISMSVPNLKLIEENEVSYDPVIAQIETDAESLKVDTDGSVSPNQSITSKDSFLKELSQGIEIGNDTDVFVDVTLLEKFCYLYEPLVFNDHVVKLDVHYEV